MQQLLNEDERSVRRPSSVPASDRGAAFDTLFQTAVVLKGIYGVVELAAGATVLIAGSAGLRSWATLLANWFASTGLSGAALWTSSLSTELTASFVLFLWIYLIIHGIVHCFLMVAALQHRTRAYPWAIGALSAFIAYQVFDLVTAFSTAMLILTVVDVVIVALTAREYRRARSAWERDGAVAHRRAASTIADEDHAIG